MWTWYRLFNQIEFLAADLVSFNGTVSIDGVGEKSFMVTKGNMVSLVWDDVMLPLYLNGKNPFRYDRLAVFSDGNNDVWIGIYSDEN